MSDAIKLLLLCPTKSQAESDLNFQQHNHIGFSMQKVNFLVQKREQICEYDSGTWYLTIYTCDGGLLEWCGKKYLALPMKCGRLDIELPPGCYSAVATWSFSVLGMGIWGNHFTHRVTFHVGCGGESCVALWNPSLHSCGFLYQAALLQNPQLPKDLVDAFVKVNTELMRAMPAAKAFEVRNFDEIKKAVLDAEHKCDDKEK